ncbi:hypothetical protein GCM10009545_27840 [Saccharopolyspora thermophila]|uniref:Uncharacterized protein n=1 Tax=Saccharopolyspora thermophila TaxID=89367 RepID=A0ABP3MNS8_9PSEU
MARRNTNIAIRAINGHNNWAIAEINSGIAAPTLPTAPPAAAYDACTIEHELCAAQNG